MFDIKQFIIKVRIPTLLLGLLLLGNLPPFIWNNSVNIVRYPLNTSIIKKTESDKTKSVNYAVFCSNTPNGESYRSYDYAYNLPLTALAWERVGFKAIVIIIGTSCEWENDPTLKHILLNLENRGVKPIFINSSFEHRTTLSQTARAFTVNMLEFPGKDTDYLITSDSDIWPLQKEHFIPPNKTADIVLVHADCCGTFNMNNKTFPMYPMSNIGAKVSTWKQIMNDDQTIANNSETIMNYLENLFGNKVRSPVIVGTESWYRDQQLVSIRLAEWMVKHGNNTVHRVSFNHGLYRVDRSDWDADTLVAENFTNQFDAHLPIKGFLPVQQKLIYPLINLMYGKESLEVKWFTNYTNKFLLTVKNYLRFNDIK